MAKINNWIRALRKYNKSQPKWTIPKKGTPAYNEVKSIQNKLGGRDAELERVTKELKKYDN